jgi:hypothetical protein
MWRSAAEIIADIPAHENRYLAAGVHGSRGPPFATIQYDIIL